MGAGKSKDSFYYDPTVNSELFDETRQCKFYRNNRGEQFEKYKVENKGQSDFENRYDYRIKNPSQYLVDAYSAKSAQNAFGCASGDQYEVVTERIPTRLFDLNNLSGKQALNITNRALKGFQQIYKSQGVMLVKDSMIGINKQNKVKVWMNSNFALNSIQQPPISYGVLPQVQKQSTMVDNIIELVNSRARKDPEWIQFVDDKYRQGRMGFDQAIHLTQNHSSHSSIGLRDNIHGNNATNPSNHQLVSSNVHHYDSKGSDHSFNPNYKQTQVSSNYNSFEHIGASTMKMSNPTVTSSNPLHTNTVVSYVHYNPEFSTQQIVNRPPPSTMSNLKNKIINGPNSINKNEAVPMRSRPISPAPISHSVHNTNIPHPQFTSTSIGSTLLSRTPQPQGPIVNSISPQIKPPVTIQNRFTFNENQNISKPRALSQGKPIVNFGGKTITPTSAQQFPAMFNNRINNLSTTSINQSPLPQNQSKPIINTSVGVSGSQLYNQNNLSNYQLSSHSNRYFAQSAQPSSSTQAISPPQQFASNISQQTGITNVPPPQPLKLMIDNKPQQSSQQFNYIQSQQRFETNPYTTVGNSIPNLYPPPNQVVNFEKKIQITQSQYPSVADSTAIQPIINQQLPKNTVLSSNVKQALGAIAGNLQSYRKSSGQKLQKNEPTIIEEVQVQSYFDEPPKFGKSPSQIRKSQTFGVNNSVQATSLYQNTNKIGDINKNASIAQSQQQKIISFRQVDTPVFDRSQKEDQRIEPYSLTFNKKKSIHSQQEDTLLAYEEQHLNLIKSGKAQNITVQQRQLLEQSVKLQQSQKLQQSLKRSQNKKVEPQKIESQFQSQAQSTVRQNKKGSNEETDRQVNQAIVKLSNSVNKKSQVKQKQSQVLKQTAKESARSAAKDEKNFNKAVRQTASNIRMQSSKISIRNSNDLKGIISYKDLRDLLKTTRKPTN